MLPLGVALIPFRWVSFHSQTCRFSAALARVLEPGGLEAFLVRFPILLENGCQSNPETAPSHLEGSWKLKPSVLELGAPSRGADNEVQHFPVTFRLLLDSFLNENQIILENIQLDYCCSPGPLFLSAQPWLVGGWFSGMGRSRMAVRKSLPPPPPTFEPSTYDNLSPCRREWPRMLPTIA